MEKFGFTFFDTVIVKKAKGNRPIRYTEVEWKQ